MKTDTQKPPRRFANLMERLRAPLPGEAEASTDAKYAKRLPEFRPQVQASSTKATASTSTPVLAKPDPKTELAKARDKGAVEAQARHANVMASEAAKGREKQAAELLLASCNRDAKFRHSPEIIAELAKRPTDAVAMWQRVISKQQSQNSAFNANDTETTSAPKATGDFVQDLWARAIARNEGIYS